MGQVGDCSLARVDPGRIACLGQVQGVGYMSTVEDVLMVKGPSVVVADPDSAVQYAVRLISQANVDSVVVKDGDAIVGILTRRDIRDRVIEKGLDAEIVTLGDVMSSPVQTCGLGDSMFSCLETFRRKRIKRLAVVADGALVGVIGLQDVFEAQVRAGVRRVEEIEDGAR